MTSHDHDNLDFEGYINEMEENTEQDHQWLSQVAILLGSKFALESLKPQGPRQRPLLSKPQRVKDISEESFRDILKLNVSMEQHYYIYSENELNTFKTPFCIHKNIKPRSI